MQCLNAHDVAVRAWIVINLLPFMRNVLLLEPDMILWQAGAIDYEVHRWQIGIA